jgi:sugar O-acyltransferase (sialic acid O-acetyltransferase NeuD family)
MIAGAGGHGKVLLDALELRGEYRIEAFLDDDKEKIGGTFEGLPVRGPIPAASEAMRRKGVSLAFLGIGSNGSRRRVHSSLRSLRFEMPPALHPAAAISRRATIGDAAVVFAGAVVNPGAVLGSGVIVNTSASVDHDCNVGDFSHIQPGARLAGGVTLAQEVTVGTGASLIPYVRVGHGTVIGAGACVIEDIPDRVVAVGVPAKVIRRI